MTRYGEPIQYVDLDPHERRGMFVEFFDEWTEQLDAAPHRHAYHEIIWLTAGSGRHTIDGRLIEIAADTVTLVTEGQVHAFQHVTDLAGYAVCFTDAFLGPELFGGDRSYRTLFNYLGGDQALRIPARERKPGVALLGLIVGEYERRPRPASPDLLRHLVHALLFQVERIAAEQRRNQLDTSRDEQRLTLSFLTLLEEQFRREHHVAFYAETLQTSPSRLTTALQRALGKPPKRVILDRLLLEARRLLQFTDLPVQEVARQLGFADPFHFSKLVKRELGASPQRYRQEQGR